MKLVLTLGKRLWLLLFVFIVAFFIDSVATSLIINKYGADCTPAVRIIAVIQDVVLFIMPAIIVAFLCTKTPATLLCIDRKPLLTPTLIGICVLISGIPAMNAFVWLNEQLPLPESFRALEDSAQGMVQALIGPHTLGNFILALLIVGVFAGLSEEILFRGAFQRLMATGGVNVHAAIWIAAAVFSAFHLQAFGFFPRLLLGAFMGYALYWTKSLWVPIILHATNNIMYLIGKYVSYNPDVPEAKSVLDTVGAGNNFLLVAISTAMVILGIYLMRQDSLKH